MKFRPKTKHFLDRSDEGKVKVMATPCIEVLHNGRWNLLGDEDGIMKFRTADERDEKIRELEGCTQI